MSTFSLFFLSEDFDFDEIYDQLPPDHEHQANLVAKAGGIGITRDRSLACVAVSEDGHSVLGAAWTAMDGHSYEFDVAVLPDFQGLGIGSQLLDAVCEPPFDVGDEQIDCTQRVVSTRMMHALARRGFEITEVRCANNEGFDVSMAPRSSLKATLSGLYNAEPDLFVAAATAVSGQEDLHRVMNGATSEPDIVQRVLRDFLTHWRAAPGTADLEQTVANCHLQCLAAIVHERRSNNNKSPGITGEAPAMRFNEPSYTETPGHRARRI